jgi:hypothetical protein
MIERRQPFLIEQEKFSTQKIVTYFLLVLFACVTVAVFWRDNDAERSTVLQTIINFTMLAIGFWLGSSKGAVDNREQLNKIMASPVQADEVKIDSEKTTVTTGDAK